MEHARKVMEMAGFFAGHAVQSVSDGEMLIPIVGYLGVDQSSRMVRLAMGSSAEAMQAGEARISELDGDTLGAVFIRDGMVTLPTGKTDCLIADVRFASDRGRRFQWLLPYRNASHASGFAVHKPKVSEGAGFSTDELKALGQVFFSGMERHEQGWALWNAHSVEQAGESSASAGQENTDFSAEEFHALCRSPVLVFLLVAASDGKFDKKEVEAFMKQLVTLAGSGSPLFSRVATNVVGNAPTLLQELVSTSMDYSAELVRVREILQARVAADDARIYCETLVALGKAVAASSGGFLGFGSKISKQEKAALEHIALNLGVSYS